MTGLRSGLDHQIIFFLGGGRFTVFCAFGSGLMCLLYSLEGSGFAYFAVVP